MARCDPLLMTEVARMAPQSSGQTYPISSPSCEHGESARFTPRPKIHMAVFEFPEMTSDPWYVGSLREITLLSAPSGLLCGGWDFPRPFLRRCSHGYQGQVERTEIAALS